MLFTLKKPFRTATVIALSVLLSACTSISTRHDSGLQDAYSDRNHDIATDVASCQHQLQTAPKNMVAELDITDIGFLNWNIKKGELNNWQEDINQLGRGKDLVLIQEAVLNPDFIGAIEGLDHWSFSPGYHGSSGLTGVMTLSRGVPLVQCNFQTYEPWVGTPKATNITAYGLTNSDKTLVVINLHGVNFTLGVTEFEMQIDQIRQILKNHSGPVILSGDFNTWRLGRMEILNTLAQDLDLTPLTFKDDHRKKVFGFHLDHSYVRGMTVNSTNTRIVTSSDHNPISASFGL
ncbi:MAG: endonuclease/exonuclease/phosphatase family protein [Pseudomonadales bacterium]|nr:endonuclease/exonuclease/phosphatase family protein [Pseudomonadales bacterium]